MEKSGKMIAAYLEGPSRDQLRVGEYEVPKPGPGQVLIRVESAPIYPGDILQVEGDFAKRMNWAFPHIPGLQAAGTVVESGGGMMGWYVMGKRVAFLIPEVPADRSIKVTDEGVFAQYAVTNAIQCVPIPDDMSFNDASNMFINPLSAIGLVETVTKDKATSVVVNAACSSVCKLMIRMFARQNVTVIAVVRKEGQIKHLQEEFVPNVKHVLNSTDENFIEDFKKITEELGCKHLLETVAGKEGGRLISNMPKDSQCYIYGTLSHDDLGGIDVFSVVEKRIQIKGYYVADWLKSKNIVKLMWMFYKLKKNYMTEYRVDISKEYDLKDFKKALEDYEGDMSQGRIIIKPWGVEEK
jgi:NADPH2:quinone reductase